MLIKRNLGTVYLDEQPQYPCVEYRMKNPKTKKFNLPKVSLRDTYKGYYSTWIVLGGVLVAEKPLLVRISWDDLEANDLIRGKIVIINRLPYRMRLLRAEGDRNHLGEWGELLDTLEEEGEEVLGAVWPTWAEAQRFPSPDVRAFVGNQNYINIRTRGYMRHDIWKDMAWRPVLEPICVDLNDKQAEESLAIWTKTGEFITGRLVDMTSYDLLLADGICIAPDGTNGSRWVDRNKMCMAVDRDGIWSVQSYTELPSN